ncbi:MAG: hypothetical protein ACXVDJ_08345 [Tumebacillaceae bacterium]
MIGGINVFAFKVNVIDKGYVNVGPQMVTDWNGYSKQNYGAGEANGDVNNMWTGSTLVNDTDAVDVPIARSSAL